MPPSVTITELRFQNFKALRSYTVSLRHMNILVGPNNSGKSTIIGAFRALASGLRKARSKSAERVPGPEQIRNGYWIESDSLPISLENVHTDYEETDTSVDFRLSNGNKLTLYFPISGGCILLPTHEGRQITSPTSFRQHFPITIGVVPVLGPVEHDEDILSEQTVRRDLATHRASRQFRNYWHQNADGFEEFSELVRKTWAGMEIQPPRQLDWSTKKLSMFCLENRMTRELFWAGFGFQIWCQLLTHVVRSRENSLLIVDEPEVYLHPDVQRQLVSILRKTGPDIVLATHSTEIMSEADPSEILLVDKSRNSAQRLRDINEVQTALNSIGSIQNITLAQIARTRRILFVGNKNDYLLLRRFAECVGLTELAAGGDITAVEVGESSSWVRVGSAAWGVARLLEKGLHVAAVLSKGFSCDEEVAGTLEEMRKCLDLSLFFGSFEIENYLLVPQLIERVIESQIQDLYLRTGESQSIGEPITVILDRITSSMRDEIQAQYIARSMEYVGDKHRTSSMAESLRMFECQWQVLDARLRLVPGKQVLGKLGDDLRSRCDISITDTALAIGIRLDEIPQDMQALLRALEYYRTL